MGAPACRGCGRPDRTIAQRGPASVGLAPTWWADWATGGSRQGNQGRVRAPRLSRLRLWTGTRPPPKGGPQPGRPPQAAGPCWGAKPRLPRFSGGGPEGFSPLESLATKGKKSSKFAASSRERIGKPLQGPTFRSPVRFVWVRAASTPCVGA